MEKETRLRLMLELTWWAATALIAWAVLRPIGQATANYPFFWQNLAFIVAALTFGRYAFQMRHAFFSKMQVVKISLTIALLPVLFVLIGTLNDFMGWVGATEWATVLGHLGEPGRSDMGRYIWLEMLFFGIASIVGGAALWVRVIISIWRTHNLGTA